MSNGNGASGPVEPAKPTPNPRPRAWMTDDISKIIEAPLRNTASQRSAAELNAVVDQFDVEFELRYRPRDITGDGKKETFCNVYVSDITYAMCAPIPHKFAGQWQDVHANAAWLKSGWNGWRPSTGHDAQAQADLGHPAVVVYDPPERTHGHIALLVPSNGAAGVWITQAGARCYRRCPLMAGFGKADNLLFYTHE